MNNKLFLGMFAAAGMLLATSCSNDELDVVQSGNEAQVTFNLGTEGGIATRAISDGKSADVLVYAVFDKDGNRLSNIQAVTKTGVTFPTTESITLAKGQTYKVAFWAQDDDCKAYTVDTDKMSVAVNYANDENKVNNDETRDAFFKTVEFTVTGSTSIDVEMKRPFAQINVGVTKEDWEAAVASGIEIENSSVVIKNAATSLNLIDGTVGTETVDVSYALNTIPNEPLYVDTDGDGIKEEYNWLSMSYILVADEIDGASKATLQSLQYTFTPENGNPIDFKEGLNTVPVQRNWRTNILGKILTGDIQFNITIDPAYDGDYIFPNTSGSIQDLEFAASFGGAVTLVEDVTMPEDRPFLQVAADFTLNINENVTFTSGNSSNYGIIVNSGTTTINGGGNIKSNGGGIGITNGANVIFNGGNLDINTTSTSGRYLFYLVGEGSTATINGGNFDFNKTQNQKRAYIYAEEGTTVYVKGGNFGKASTRDGYTTGILGNGTVIITGGSFKFDPSAWVPTDYKVEKVGSTYYVLPANAVSVSNSNDLEAVLNGSESNIDASVAIDYSNNQIRIDRNLIFDMNNNKVKAGSASAYGLVADGVYVQFDEANIYSLGGGVGAVNGANVVFNGGKLEINTTSTSGRYLFYANGEGSTITINDGNFNFNKTQNQKRAYIYAESGTTVYVKGGNFGEASTRSGYTAGILGEGTVIITGGSFGFDPSAWVASGYTATENNGVWTVSAN